MFFAKVCLGKTKLLGAYDVISAMLEMEICNIAALSVSSSPDVSFTSLLFESSRDYYKAANNKFCGLSN